MARNKLWRILESYGVKIGLIKKLKLIYEDTVMMVRTSEGLTKDYKTKKGVR